MLCAIPFAEFLCHDHLLEFLRQPQRDLDIFRLGGLISARQKDDDFHAALREIDAVSRTVIDTHFQHAMSDGLAIAKIAIFGTVDARLSVSLLNQLSKVAVVRTLFMC